MWNGFLIVLVVVSGLWKDLFAYLRPHLKKWSAYTYNKNHKHISHIVQYPEVPFGCSFLFFFFLLYQTLYFRKANIFFCMLIFIV